VKSLENVQQIGTAGDIAHIVEEGRAFHEVPIVSYFISTETFFVTGRRINDVPCSGTPVACACSCEADTGRSPRYIVQLELQHLSVCANSFSVLAGVDLLDDSAVVTAWSNLDRGCSAGKRKCTFTGMLTLRTLGECHARTANAHTPVCIL
jgi:hypothetical protein